MRRPENRAFAYFEDNEIAFDVARVVSVEKVRNAPRDHPQVQVAFDNRSVLLVPGTVPGVLRRMKQAWAAL